jgi:protein-tyrosine phosphatase
MMKPLISPAPVMGDTRGVAFHVLYVCTGNVCRSPMAELLLRAWADQRGGLTVSSAGTRALVGHPIDRGSASALGQLGIDPTPHRARQFEPGMATRADLILTAERSHLGEIFEQVPASFRRAFTIKEFARIAPHITAGDPYAAVAEAAAIRGLVERPSDPLADDVRDPYRRATLHAKSVAEELTGAVKATLDALGLTPQPTRSERPLPYRR